jgi:(+)-neomenthol dehydrogenase
MSKEEREVWMYSKVRETLSAVKDGIRTNYYGTKDVTKALLPLLKASPDGKILLVSSNFGLIGVNNNLSYVVENIERWR